MMNFTKVSVLKTLLVAACLLLNGGEVAADSSSSSSSSSPAKSTKSPSKRSKKNGKKSSSDDICSSDCFQAKDTPGCSDPDCSDLIGLLSPGNYCANDEWDSECASAACFLCDGFDDECDACNSLTPAPSASASPSASAFPTSEPCEPPPSTSNCFLNDNVFGDATRTTCDNEACQEAVYALDANVLDEPDFCKNRYWDGLCAQFACIAPECAGLEKGCSCDFLSTEPSTRRRERKQ